MPVQIKPTNIQNLPIYLGKHQAIEVRYDSKAHYTRDQIVDAAKKVRDRYKKSLEGVRLWMAQWPCHQDRIRGARPV